MENPRDEVSRKINILEDRLAQVQKSMIINFVMEILVVVYFQ